MVVDPFRILACAVFAAAQLDPHKPATEKRAKQRCVTVRSTSNRPIQERVHIGDENLVEALIPASFFSRCLKRVSMPFDHIATITREPQASSTRQR